jgi:hypothetical protein
MLRSEKLLRILPRPVREAVDTYADTLEVLSEMKDPRILASLGPAGLRGLVLRRGKQGVPTKMPAHHSAHFDWTYPHDHEGMRDLYLRAKKGQWDGDYLPWHISVDVENPDVPIMDPNLFNWKKLDEMGIKLSPREQQRMVSDMAAWMLSQFLHGEQGALFAAAQVTEAVQFFDGKFYGATQVMDEGRHVEVFHRYLDTKIEKLYQINDNLFVIIDALMTDGRWDMKFLGMQIMVEGLALGAFSTLYRQTSEPLLKELLKNVIQDEARHVHYGVLALGEHIRTELSESERREREDWAFEVALLMRNRFYAYEVYEEWFEHKMSRAEWRALVSTAPGMEEFRHVMFRRLIPNLREIGLLSERIRPAYQRVGLLRYFGEKAANEITGDDMIRDLDAAVAAAKAGQPEYLAAAE